MLEAGQCISSCHVTVSEALGRTIAGALPRGGPWTYEPEGN